jgi:type II secretory pathway component GspD/PulD (secretin)
MVTVGDMPSYIKRIDEFIDNFKKNIKKQAIIEVEVFEVQFDKQNAYGIDWDKVITNLSNAGANISQISLSSGLSPGLAAGAGSGVSVFGISDRVQGRTATRSKDIIFQVLSTYGKIKMLSRPQLRVINNQAAFIGVGEVVPYLKSVERDVSAQGGLEAIRPQIEQVRTGLTLMLMPFIETEKKRVTMEVSPLFNEIREFREFDLGEQMKFSNPVITTRQVVTLIEAKDGETVIMGGILMEVARNDIKEVPVLSRIPLLGKIFRGVDRQRKKIELVVSLTPRILSDIKDKKEKGDD